MFFAWRDVLAARVRTLLLGLVVALVATLVVVVSGFASGLTDDTTSAIGKLPADRLAFDASAGSEQFARSLIPGARARRWSQESGVTGATPFGTAIVHGRSSTGTDVDLAVFGVPPRSPLSPGASRGRPLGGDDEVVVSSQLADNGVRVGQRVTVSTPPLTLTVVGVTGRSSFGHVPAAYTSLRTWQRIRFALPAGRPVGRLDDQVTGVALDVRPGTDVAPAARRLGMHVFSRSAAFAGAPGYTGEYTIMTTIRVFLYVIAALVVAAFFMVTTLQRRRELAVIRALGASRWFLLRTTLLQAVLLVAPAVAVGVLAGAGLGALLRHRVPFLETATAIASAGGLLSVVGVAGALVAVRPILRTDPLTALAGPR